MGYYDIDSPVLPCKNCFKVPSRSSRYTLFFYVPPTTTNYIITNESVRRLMSNANADTAFNGLLIM